MDHLQKRLEKLRALRFRYYTENQLTKYMQVSQIIETVKKRIEGADK